MKVIPYEQHIHYPVLCDWWKQHKWTDPVPAKSLPDTGLVVESDDGSPLAAGFVYFHTTNVALITWLVTNPRKKAAVSAAEVCMKELIHWVYDVVDDAVVITFAADRAHKRILERCHMVPGENTQIYSIAASGKVMTIFEEN